MQYDAFLILAVLTGILFLAGIATSVLSASTRDAATLAALENVNARVRSWWWMIFTTAAAVLAGRIGVTALFAFASFIALREFLAVTAIRAEDRRVVIAIFTIALPGQYVLAASGSLAWFQFALPIFAIIALPVLLVLTGETREYLARTSHLMSGVMLCVYCISYAPALLMLDAPGYERRQVFCVVFLILVAQSSDVLQYLWGKLLGRHKVAPAISPSKTVEGLLGGVASATALGAGLWWITPFTVIQAATLALVIALAGFLGGLVMSAIKRDCGIKDWSRFLPGHGGMLDRLDSIWLSAPVFFYFSRMLLAR